MYHMRAVVFGLLLFAVSFSSIAAPIDIGSNLEPMVDDYLIASMENVSLQLHKPIPREVAITFDAPWEGNVCCYVTVFEDDGLFRMYFRGSHYEIDTKTIGKERVCYAESADGIHWVKPKLGLFEYEGSKENNIIWEGVGVHNFTPFKDTNPDCPPEAQYKALASGPDKARLVPFQSADAIHWELIQEEAVITKGAFDSQNLAFYDNVRGQYVEFHRGFKDGVRAIMTSTSADFIHWTEPVWLDYGDTPDEHLYTNATIAYPRAPHIFMAFPKRFVPKRQSSVHPVNGVSDGVFMTSRDGLHWNRWREALIRPGLQASRWVNRNNMTAFGILRTQGTLPETPDEYSLYSTEGYYVGPCHLRRYTIRQDGFVSVNAPGDGGSFTTKPIVFAGDPVISGDPGTPKAQRVDGALLFEQPAIMTIPGTQELGKQATLAAKVRNVPRGHRRLFSAYNGGAVSTTKGEFWFDFDASGKSMGMRVGCEGELVETNKDALPVWSGSEKSHYLAATWDDGVVTLYFDGKQVAQGGTKGRGALAFALGDLLFGEDYPPAVRTNEQFLGLLEEVVVMRQALDADTIQALADKGAENAGLKPAPGDVLYTFAGDDGIVLNRFAQDGTGDTVLPGQRALADTELVLNYSTSVAGTIRCELRESDGTPIPGYTLADCDEIFGDAIEQAVTWNGRSELKALEGTPIQIHFTMSDADLYSIRFR